MIWTEFDCPVCGMDSDIEPPLPLGAEYRCSSCGRTSTLTRDNAQSWNEETGEIIPAQPPLT